MEFTTSSSVPSPLSNYFVTCRQSPSVIKTNFLATFLFDVIAFPGAAESVPGFIL